MTVRSVHDASLANIYHRVGINNTKALYINFQQTICEAHAMGKHLLFPQRSLTLPTGGAIS